MPNKDGIEFCKDVKSDLITNHIPFIMLTARSSIKNKIEGLEIGADAYISKPFHIEILTAQIQNLLNQRELLKLKFSGNGLRFTSRIKGIKKSEKQFLEKAEKIIDKNLTNSQFGVPDLGKGIGLSRMQLYRKLKSIRGLNANEFIREYRIKKAAQLMGTTELNVSEILFEVGFSNRSYFTKCFKKLLGVTPREYIKKMESETTDFI
jgi:YesN/AraC family two-component response regulator